MRSWHRSAIASTVAPVRSATRTAKFMVGPTAYGSGSAPVHTNSSSAIADNLELADLELARAVGEGGKERVDRLADLGSSVESVPRAAHRADQLVARVDRHQEELAGPCDDRLDIGRELLREP